MHTVDRPRSHPQTTQPAPSHSHSHSPETRSWCPRMSQELGAPTRGGSKQHQLCPGALGAPGPTQALELPSDLASRLSSGRPGGLWAHCLQTASRVAQAGLGLSVSEGGLNAFLL